MQHSFEKFTDVGTILGSAAGIISFIKIFGFNKFLSPRQRSMLVAIEDMDYMYVTLEGENSTGYQFGNLKLDLFSHYVFSISPEHSRDKYDPSVDVPFSSLALLLLEDLYKRQLVDKPQSQKYMMTQKAIKLVRIYKLVLRIPWLKSVFFFRSDLYGKPFGSK